MLTSKAQKSLAQQNQNPVDPRQFLPGGTCKFDAANAHHKFEKDQTALRAMFKHIFKDNRHNSINFDQSQMMLDSVIDMSDFSATQKHGQSTGFGQPAKSRQGTTDMNYTQNTQGNKQLNNVLTQRSNSIVKQG